MNDDNIPDCQKILPPFKYLSDPHGWRRSQAVTGLPSAGDFLICSIDAVASVAHLDEEARHAARKLRSRHYVAFVMGSTGVCFGHEPINAFSFTFVRQGLPHVTPEGRPVFLDHCIPVMPNICHPTGRKSLCPAHPLPWKDCYVDTSPDFNLLEVRVTATPRDYTVVLPCDEDQMDYMVDRMADDMNEHYDRVDDMQHGSIEAIAALALPPSPSSAFKIPLPPSPVHGPIHLPVDHIDSDLDKIQRAISSNGVGDEISIIASDDGASFDEGDSGLADAGGFDIGLLLEMEALFDTSGDVNDPVVNVWYDLDMVQEIPDPLLFLEERAKIRNIIADAEARLGIKQAREEAAAGPQAFNPFRSDEPATVAVGEKEMTAITSPTVALIKSESGSSCKSSLFARLADKSRGLLRKGSLYFRPFVCHSMKSHDPFD